MVKRKAVASGERVYENIIAARLLQTYDVRVWFARTKEGPTFFADEGRLLELLDELTHEETETIDGIAGIIADRLAGVSAVEVKTDGAGVVIYNDWP
jgi:hypothetical protein